MDSTLPDGGEAPDRTDDPGEEPTVEELLLSAGVVRERADGEDLRLAEDFEEAWHDRIEGMRGGDRATRWLARARGVDPEDVALDPAEDGVSVVIEGQAVGTWPSEASFVAELVAEPTLREWLSESEWERLPEEGRRDLAARLLVFLERCPDCGGDLAFGEAEADRVTLSCPTCGTVLFDQPAP